MTKKNRKVKKIIKLGAEVVGQGTGALIGSMFDSLGMPVSSMIGAISSPIITAFSKVCYEIVERHLSTQEEKRVGSFLILAANKIEEKIKKGESIRKDWFEIDRISGDEILEGVLTTAQRDYEEGKLKYYGNLFCNLAFDTKIDKHEANFLINIAKNLNYRDLCLLRIAGAAKQQDLPIRINDYRNYNDKKEDLVILLTQIYRLYQLGLINCGEIALLGILDIIPAKLRAQGVGVILYNLMELYQIEKSEIENYLKILIR